VLSSFLILVLCHRAGFRVGASICFPDFGIPVQSRFQLLVFVLGRYVLAELVQAGLDFLLDCAF